MKDLARLQPAVELLKALAAPVRLGFVETLSTGPRCVHEIVDDLGVSQPLASQHLRVLHGAGLVAAGRRGREIEYRLPDEHVAHLVRDLLRHAAEPHEDLLPCPMSPTATTKSQRDDCHRAPSTEHRAPSTEHRAPSTEHRAPSPRVARPAPARRQLRARQRAAR